MKTIFNLMEKKPIDEIIRFDEFLLGSSWTGADHTNKDWGNCILINTDAEYNIYLCWNNNALHLTATCIYRKYKNE